jgi:prophage regulatory protein
MAGKLLRLREVCQDCGISKSTLWLGVQKGTFPRPVKHSERCTRWVESEIETWKAALIEKRDGPAWATKPGRGRKGGAHEHEQPAT